MDLIYYFVDKLNIFSFLLEHIFYKVLYMSITSSILFIFIKLISFIFKDKMIPNCKMLVWSIFLISLIVPYRFESEISVMENYEKIQSISYKDEYRKAKENLQVAVEDGNIDKINTEQLNEKRKEAFSKSFLIDVLIPIIWLAGIFVSLLFFIISYLKVRKRIHKIEEKSEIYNYLDKCKSKLKLNKNIKIAYSNYFLSPSVLGAFKPVIIIPDYIDEKDNDILENVLLHELSHIKRKDTFLNELIIILKNIYWFNPILFLAFNDIKNDIEIANDEFVTKNMDISAKTKYMKSLVWVLAKGNGIQTNQSSLCMADDKNNIERRVKIMKNDNISKNRKRILSILILCLTFVFSACVMTDKKENENQIIFPAYENNLKTDNENEALESLENEIYSTPKFEVNVELPNNWKITLDDVKLDEETLLPPSEFYTRYYILENDKIIGYIGFNRFEPYEEEIEESNYYKTVWTELRLSSMTIWDPFTSVKRNDNFESGICQIEFLDYTKMEDDVCSAELPIIKTNGVLAYDKNLQCYVGMGFVKDTVTEDEIKNIAESMSFELIEQKDK